MATKWSVAMATKWSVAMATKCSTSRVIILLLAFQLSPYTYYCKAWRPPSNFFQGMAARHALCMLATSLDPIEVVMAHHSDKSLVPQRVVQSFLLVGSE